MRWLKRLFALMGILAIVAASGYFFARRPLPFPTPGQQDLVVLTRQGPLTYLADENGNASGLEHDLIEAFALELGVGVRYIVVQPGEMADRLGDEDYHLATAWLSPSDDPEMQATPPIFMSRDILMQNEASLPLTEVSELAGKTVHVMANSRQAASLKRLAREVGDLKIVETGEGDVLDLLEKLGTRNVDYVVIDERLVDVANQYVPSLRATLPLGEAQPIVWQLGHHPNAELNARVRAFVERIQLDGTLERFEERYFGHVRRLDQFSVTRFLAEIRTTLPRLRPYFEAAQTATGLDWRLIAAVAYHESRWDSSATSFTNVRGIMMLTEETADRLGVSNRLDARESILAGARYINMLKDMLPAEIAEPDRTWLALAGYNLGPGHLNAARTIAKQLNADPNAWFEMKRILPLLAKPQYYQRLKAGKARGGEAVILVENIRAYYDILVRNEAPYQPHGPEFSTVVGSIPGLKIKR